MSKTFKEYLEATKIKRIPSNDTIFKLMSEVNNIDTSGADGLDEIALAGFKSGFNFAKTNKNIIDSRKIKTLMKTDKEFEPWWIDDHDANYSNIYVNSFKFGFKYFNNKWIIYING